MRLCATVAAYTLPGVDEAGRGPLAGPVVAAAVILPAGLCLPEVNDSKRLTPAVRARLSAVIREQALAWNLGMAEPGEIDALNIRRATLTAMVRAVRGLRIAPDLVLVDGRDTIDVGARCIAVVGGDCRSQCVAAASILAKVTRDELMTEMDRLYPGYGFAQHKGYPTPQHLEALRRLGPCSIHRLTFRGVGVRSPERAILSSVGRNSTLFGRMMVHMAITGGTGGVWEAG